MLLLVIKIMYLILISFFVYNFVYKLYTNFVYNLI